MMMKLSIIIVNYNTRDLTFRCLQALYRLKSKLETEIIVVDNASADNSVTFLKQTFPDIQFIQNDKNYGFGPANNQGATAASGEYLLFLNSDTENIGDSLLSLVTLAEENHSQIATCRLVDQKHQLQSQGGALPNLFNLFALMFFIDDLPLIKHIFPAYQQRQPVYFSRDQHPGWIGGTVMLIQKSTFISLNGFNPAIFMYGEDVDLCYRARGQKIRIDYYHQPEVMHLGQGSGVRANAVIGEVKFWLYFWQTYKPAWQLRCLRLIIKFGCLLRTSFFGMIGRDDLQKIYQSVRLLV